MIRHFLVVPNRVGKLSRLPLFETFENTDWRGVGNNVENQSQFQKIYSLQDVIMLNVRKGTSDGANEDKLKVKSLLSGTVFCVVGLFIRLEKSTSKVYYLILLPSDNVSKICLYLIQKHRDTTNTIDKHMCITTKVQKLLDSTNWDCPHDLICDVTLPDESNENLWFQFFVPRPGQIQIIGNSSLKEGPAKIFEYNKLTGKMAVLVKSGKQMKREDRDKKRKLNSLSGGVLVEAGSVVLTDCAFQKLKASDNYDAYMKEKRVSGIRSVDSGGLVALHPLLIDANSEMTFPVALSEMHTVTTIKDVFKIEHTFTTITSAIEKFQLNCEEIGIVGDGYQKVLSAVASVLLEDISWRMVAEESVEQFLKTIKVDIDQVSLHIKKVNIYNFEHEIDEFLLKMYKSLMDKVLLAKDVTYCLLNVNYKQFMSDASKKGGHTYMTAYERKKFVPLISEGKVGDVFKISVHLHNDADRLVNIETIWEAHVAVTIFLETLSPRATYQQSICVKQLLDNQSGYTHKLASGPLLPLLVSLYLSSTIPGGISIAIETFNNKVRTFFNLNTSDQLEISLATAQMIGDQLMTDWHFKMPCIIERFSEWVEQNVEKLGGLQPSLNKLIWGVGCTVSTVVASQTENAPLNETSPVVVSCGSNYLSQFESNRDLATTNLPANCVPAYTVVNYGHPPFMSLCNNPTKWYEGAPCNAGSAIDPSSEQISESDGQIENCPSYDSDAYDSDESLEFNEKGVESDYESGNNKSSKDDTELSKEVDENGKNKMFPCVALTCKRTHVTYPTHGGILPLEYQSTTIFWDKIKVTSDDINLHGNFKRLNNSIRSQCYNLSSRYAAGEYNVTLKSSKEMGCVFLDIFTKNENAIFNMTACKERAIRFKDNNELTLNGIQTDGSPARVEVAFVSPYVTENRITLINGIRDTVNIALKHTKSYHVKPVITVARFLLSGVLAKLSILEEMIAKKIPAAATYDELTSVRLEVAALLRSYHSGKGKLNAKYMPAPKLSYLACRPITNRMMPLMEECRQTTLRLPLVDLEKLFMSGLVDVNGTPHVPIQMPSFVRKYDEIFVQKYLCGQYCDRCFKTFSTQLTIDAFETHSCTTIEKGRKLNVTDKRFAAHIEKLGKQLTATQKLLLEELKNGSNIFLTGYAGTGKSFTLTFAILYYLVKYGMYTFAVISPTKIAAGLVGGMTYHSFLKIEKSTTSTSPNETPLRSKHVIKQEAIDKANGLVIDDKQRYLSLKFGLRILFVDEVSMLSHDQLYFADYYFRTIRQNDKPFGGLQICLCGDALQLAPLVDQPKAPFGGAKPPRHPVYFFETISFLSGKFKVLYLTEIYRQKNLTFTLILNQMRDGYCDSEMCDYINTKWGDKVNKICAKRVLLALHEQFDDEMAEFKAIDAATEWTANGWQSGKVDILINRLKKYCNNDLLFGYYSFMYNTDTNEKIEGADFSQCELSTKYLRHIERLPETDDTEIYNPVLTSENREVSVINEHYTYWRKTIVIPIESIDSVDRANISWTPYMSNSTTKLTKLETVLNFSVGQTVSFTSNDVDPNAANNSRGTVVDIQSIDGIIEHIVVAPILARSDLIPHPIKVYRQTRTVAHYDAKLKITLQLTRSQFPLRSADACTINTIQGSAMTEPHIVNSQRSGNRSFGRMYVACSRATDDVLVFILFEITPSDVVACPIALAFDLHHRPKPGTSAGLSDVNYTLHIHNDGKNCLLLPVST